MGNSVILLKRHHAIIAASSPKLVTVSGTQSISLPNALSMPIKSLKVEGSSALSATPSPSTPATITTNYGTLVPERYELPAEYQYIDGITFGGRTYYVINDLYLTGADTVRLSFSFNTNCNIFGCYDNDSSGDRYSLYVSSSSGAKYMRYGSNAYDSYFPSSARGDRFDVTITPTGVSGMYTDSTWEQETFTSSVSMCIGLTGPGVTSTKFSGNMYGCFVVEGRFKGIPCIRKSDNNVGYYDTYSKQFYAPIGSNPSALEVSHSTITFGNNTIEVAELFAVGDYKDTQDTVSGEITRRVGIKVLDGTENWREATHKGVFYTSANVGVISETYPVLSNVYIASTLANNIMPDLTAKVAQTIAFDGAIHIVHDAYQEQIDEFKAYLAAQYAAGTPVIVIYPLTTPITEQATAQPIKTTYSDSNIITTNNTISVSYWQPPFPCAVKTFVRRNYSPDGASWSDTAAINLNAGDFIEAKIDLTGCTGSSENILSIGSIIDTWAIGSSPNHTAGTEDVVVHLYYPKDGALALDVSYTVVTDGTEKKHQRNLDPITLSSNILTVRLDKTGLHINGGENVMPEYTALPIIMAQSTLTIGSMEGTSRSHATYEYIEIVNK